jgi:hypothetical protein
MKDDEPTPEEEREAAALAEALAGRPGAGAPPEALQTAALLRFSHGSGLDPARARALATELRAQLRPRRRWRWVAAPAALAVAALVLVLVWPRRPELPSLAALPSPGPALLAAQAEAARGRAEALQALELQMRAYRRTLFANLQRESR